jgi:hypothetical protein
MSELQDLEFIEVDQIETKKSANDRKLLVRRRIEEAIELKRLREEFGTIDGLD